MSKELLHDGDRTTIFLANSTLYINIYIQGNRVG